MIVLGMFVGHCGRRTFVIAVSLAHVSEFSFVLSSRARRMGIISREVSVGSEENIFINGRQIATHVELCVDHEDIFFGEIVTEESFGEYFGLK